MYNMRDLDALYANDDHDATYDYFNAFADDVPRSAAEAREKVAFVVELVPEAARPLKRRSVETLIALRRLEREAEAEVDSCVPPLKLEARALRSLIAYLAKPAIIELG